MSDTTEVNTGAAGALVMIFLTIAFVILLESFYRRYKRANKPENEQE